MIYFSSTNWKDFETSNARKIVEVTGEFNDSYIKKMGWTEQFKKASLIVQFKVNIGQSISNRQLNKFPQKHISIIISKKLNIMTGKLKIFLILV